MRYNVSALDLLCYGLTVRLMGAGPKGLPITLRGGFHMKETFEVVAAVCTAVSRIAMAVKSIAELIMLFFI